MPSTLVRGKYVMRHGVWLTDEDIDLIAETGTMICHNASSNLRLQSGVAPLNHYAQKGVRVGMGLDEAGINDDRDMLQEMRLVLKLHRVPGVDKDALLDELSEMLKAPLTPDALRRRELAKEVFPYVKKVYNGLFRPEAHNSFYCTSCQTYHPTSG